MGDERIVLDFVTLSGASADIGAAINSMNSQLSQLESDAAPLVHDWEGEAQQAYTERQKQWRASANHLAEMLRDIQKAMDETAERFRHADKTAAGGF